MDERQYVLVCMVIYPLTYVVRISAYEIHEWINDQLLVREDTVSMIQIDGPKRQVFIKFLNLMYAQEVLNATSGQAKYKHTNREISIVQVDMAGIGTKRVRIVNLPPETKEKKIRTPLSQYGEIRDFQYEKWSKAYRYVMDNGIQIVVITQKKHIKSHLAIAVHRVLAVYDGQIQTCYGCGETGHLCIVCTRRRRAGQPSTNEPTFWATIAARAPQTQGSADKRNETTSERRHSAGPTEEAITSKEIQEHVASTHCKETTVDQRNRARDLQ